MRIHSILNRYLAKNFLLAFVGTLFVLISLIYLFDVIDLLRRASSRDYLSFATVLKMGVIKSPQMFPLLVPFAVLIASIICFMRLSKSQELVIARSVGMSVWNILTPILIVVGVIGVLNMTALNPFSTMMRQRYTVLESTNFRKNTGFSWTNRGLWIREKMDNVTAVIHADSVLQEGKTLSLNDVSVLFLNENESLVKQIESPSGSLIANTLFVSDGLSWDENGDKEKTNAFSLKTELNLDKIIQTFEEPEKISFWKLPSFIRTLNKAGFSSAKHRVYYYSLWATIFYLIAMVLIAAVFSISPNQRQGRPLLKVSSAVVGGFVLFFISKVTMALGIPGTLPVFLATFGPSLMAICFCLYALLRTEDG